MPVQPTTADTTMLTEQCPLSRREHQVLVLLAKGDTTKQLAEYLGCSENTVKYHVKSILKKLGVSSRVQAVSAALTHGWLEQE